MSPRTRAILELLGVAFLWSTSFILIKLGMRDESIPPLTFAGLRYFIAFLILLPFTLPVIKRQKQALPRSLIAPLLGYGIIHYAIAQGAQFVALQHLTSSTVNLILSMTIIPITLVSIAALKEAPKPLQWVGIGVYGLGVAVYFSNFELSAEGVIGVIAAGIALTTNAVSSIWGRSINRKANIPPSVVTVISMGAGSSLLLTVGLFTQGLPPLSLNSLLIIAWLASINTALTFTLFNRALRHLTAIEASMLNNTMLAWIPLLAWVFLGEELTAVAILGLVIVGVGILLVQGMAPNVLRAWPRRLKRVDIES